LHIAKGNKSEGASFVLGLWDICYPPATSFLLTFRLELWQAKELPPKCQGIKSIGWWALLLEMKSYRI